MEKYRGVNPNFSNRIYVFLSLALLVSILLCELPAFANDVRDTPSRVTLNADRISYDGCTGRATAEGNAVLTHGGSRIRAALIEYDAFSQDVRALPSPGGSVLLETMGRAVVGDSLEFNLETQEGTLSGIRSSFQVGYGILRISGGKMQIMPYELALERGLISGARGDVPYVGFMQDVAVTTCTQDHPHYRLETTRIIFIPGQRLVARRPRFYLGDTFIFTYPMDYIVHLERRALEHSIIPYVQSTDRKGVGVGLGGALQWDSGAVRLGAAYWSSVGIEWMAGVEQSIGRGLSIEGGVEYLWSSAWDEKQYTTRVGLRYERRGWEVALRRVWKEYLEIQKDATYEHRGRLDRKPEFTVLSPWMQSRTQNQSWFRLGAVAGSYRERTPLMVGDTIARYGLTLQNYFERPMGRGMTFFSNITYGAWFYSRDDSNQQVIDGIIGLRYNWGDIELASGYERRHVWGESPMLWDSVRERERIHQKIRFPVSGNLFLAARGSYDTRASMIDQVNYALQWVTDCMKWELRFHNDRTSGSNNSIGLSVFILAYPNTPASFGERRPHDPFEPPAILGRRRN